MGRDHHRDHHSHHHSRSHHHHHSHSRSRSHRHHSRRDDKDRSRSSSESRSRSRSRSRDTREDNLKRQKPPTEVLYGDGYNAPETKKPREESTGPKPFIWDKKVKDMKEKGLDYKQYLKDAKSGAAVAQLQEEKERIRLAREERERERELMEAERAKKRRLEAQMGAEEIEMSEEEFQLRQATKRAQIRAALGKARPVDRVYLTVHSEDKTDGKYDKDNVVPTHMRYNEDPAFVVERCDPSELAEVLKSIQGFALADAEDRDKKEFWSNLLVLCRDKEERLENEIRDQRRGGHGDLSGFTAAAAADDSEGSASARAKNDAIKIFESKSGAELEKLRAQISSKLASAVNYEYWSFLYQKTSLFLARAKVREYYSALLDRLGKAAPDSQPSNVSPSSSSASSSINKSIKREDEDKKDGDNESDYESGMSPVLIDEGEEGEEVVDAEEDASELARTRKEITEREARILSTKPELFSETVSIVPEVNANATSASSLQGLTASVAAAGWMTEEQMYNIEASRGMEEDESVFNSTVTLSADQQVQLWHDKFRPRKPRFFNRIHAGFAWSKYNRAHYDPENPPPKVVQGYKFNVFYPDLIDKTQVPSFFLEKDPENPEDFCILRIHAGPPYEDIAFRIVNREWEMSYRKGFKCVFDRGVFHLWFNFKKYRYRR